MTRRLLSLALVAAAGFGITLPRPSGDVTIKLPFGQTTLSHYRGKVIVFSFILTG